jgi:hypothetical protein
MGETIHTLLGLVAAVNLRLSRIRINFLPLNVIFLGLLIWQAGMGLGDLQRPDSESFSSGVLRIALCAPVLILYLVSAVKRHTIFRPSLQDARVSESSSSASNERRRRQTVTLSFATVEQRERLLHHLARTVR